MIEWFTRNGVAANLLMVSILVWGTYSALYRIPLEVFPDPDIDTVNVSVAYRGATPEEVEEGVIVPIEEAIQDLEPIDQIQATASEGSGSVRVEIKLGYDGREALEDIKSRIDAINNFPVDIEKPNVSLSESSDTVITVILSGNLDEREMRILTDQVKDDLLNLPRTTQASILGVRNYEIAIEVPESNLLKYDLTLEEVATAVQNQSVDLSAGSVKTAGGEILLRTKAKSYVGDEFERIVVRSNPDGTKLTVGQIAAVRDAFEETPVEARFNGKRSVLIAVNRVGDQNAIAIAEEVKGYIAQKRDALPQGVSIDVWRDRSEIVEGRLDTLIGSFFWGLILVFVVTALFLRFSLALWVAMGIPFCFAGALAVMPEVGATINISSLFGFILVLGILVDDAIVTSENVYRKLRTAKDSTLATIEGVKEVAIPVTFGILTTVVAFMPILFMSGYRGAMFKQIPLVVIPALIFSLIESKLILPAHLKHIRPGEHRRPARWNLLGRVQQKVSRGLEIFIERVYEPFLIQVLRQRYIALAVFLFMVLWTAGMIAGKRVVFTPFPRVASEFVNGRLVMPAGTPYEVTSKYVDQMENAALALQEKYTDPETGKSVIENIFSSRGGQGLTSSYRGSSSSGVSHVGEVSFEVIPPEDRVEISFTADSRQISNEWRDLIGDVPGAEELNFRAEIGRYGDPVDIQLEGSNFVQLEAAAVAVQHKLAEYPDLFDISSNFDDGKEEVQLALKPEGQLLGIDSETLARQTRGAFFGYEAQRIQRGRDDIRVMVRYPLSERESIGELRDLRIRAADGSRVPFTTVAEFETGRSYSSIRRVDRNRVINVIADADKDKTDLESIVASLKEELPILLAEYPTVRWELEGEEREKRETGSTLTWGLIFSFLGIYILLAIPLKSYLQPILVMTAIPYGLIGAVLGHMLLGEVLSFMSLFGMLALAGVVVNDSLLMVDHVNHSRKEGISLEEAARTGGGRRFRPILLTSITTFAGLMPLLFETSTQAQFLIPMAISLGFGILFATAVTLFLVPVQYLILEDLKRLARRGWRWYVRPFGDSATPSASTKDAKPA